VEDFIKRSILAKVQGGELNFIHDLSGGS
jgi:hypothetical protein